MRIFLPLLSAALFFSSTGFAQDHLEPEDSAFSRWYYPKAARYEELVVSKLIEAFEQPSLARAVVTPSFEPEYAVAIQEKDGHYYILHLQPDAQLWPYELLRDAQNIAASSTDPEERDLSSRNAKELREKFPVPIDKVAVERCEIEIPASAARQLLVLIDTALRQTRYPEDGIVGLDGVTYHFSGNFGIQQMAGQIWSPSPKSKMGALVSIVDHMRDACLEKDNIKANEGETQARRLCRKIGCPPPTEAYSLSGKPRKR